MTVAANLDRLVETRVVGEVTNPYLPEGVYLTTRDGQAFVPVGPGGIHFNVLVGMGAFDFAADQVQPGVSIANPVPAANQALSTFSCVGDRAVVLSGPAAGAEGVVTGRHEEFSCFQHVLIDFEEEATKVMCPGDRVVVHALGVGLKPAGLDAVDFHATSPRLWEALDCKLNQAGALEFPVVAQLPPQAMGIGSGRVSAATSVCLQLDSESEAKELGGQLRLGDLVAVVDWDARFNTGYRPGSVVIGVITTGASRWPGHGPAVTILASGRQQQLHPKVTSGVNLAKLLGIGTGRPR